MLARMTMEGTFWIRVQQHADKVFFFHDFFFISCHMSNSKLNPFRAPKPLPILIPSSFIPKNGFPGAKALTLFFSATKNTRYVILIPTNFVTKNRGAVLKVTTNQTFQILCRVSFFGCVVFCSCQSFILLRACITGFHDIALILVAFFVRLVMNK